MNRFTFEGMKIAYTHRGHGGPPVVMLHNAGASHAIWDAQAASLASRYDVYALDLYGYGQSSQPPTGYTLDRYTSMARQFLYHRGISAAAFVGNCLGSAISLNLARQTPDKVTALVLMNLLTQQTARSGTLGGPAWLAAHAPAIAARAAGTFNPPGWLAREIVRYWFATSAAFHASPQVRGLRAGWSKAATARALLSMMRDLNAFAALEEWPDRETLPPICTVWGMDNKVLSPAAGLIINRKLVPQRQEWLAGCGHAPMLEQPGTVSTIITEFLGQQLSRQQPSIGVTA